MDRNPWHLKRSNLLEPALLGAKPQRFVPFKILPLELVLTKTAIRLHTAQVDRKTFANYLTAIPHPCGVAPWALFQIAFLPLFRYIDLRLTVLIHPKSSPLFLGCGTDKNHSVCDHPPISRKPDERGNPSRTDHAVRWRLKWIQSLLVTCQECNLKDCRFSRTWPLCRSSSPTTAVLNTSC